MSKWDRLSGQLPAAAVAALMEAQVAQLDAALDKTPMPAWAKSIAWSHPIDYRPPIISVQPMSSPVGGIAFYKPRYGAKELCIVDALSKLAEGDAKNPYGGAQDAHVG